MSAHSQTPPGSVGPVPLEGISGAILSGCPYTPRHLQGVWDEFPWMESPEQSHPDICTLPDTSRECGTGSPGWNLRSNLVQTSRHSQTPPGSVGPVPLDGISGANLSGRLHTPRHLQGVWDQFPWMESLEQCCPDVCTLPDTSRECGMSSPGWNLWSNLVQTSAHSQTPPGSVGQVPLDGISRAMLSGHLHTPRHLQGVWDEFPRMESLEQSRPDICTLPYTSRECGMSSPGWNLWSNVTRTSAHSQTPPGSVGPVRPDGISREMSSRRPHTPRHLQGVWDEFPWMESSEQSHLDVQTLPDTSRECGMSSPGWNLRAISSGHLHTPIHLQGVWDEFPWTESLEQSHLDVCTLQDTSRECGMSSPRWNLWSNVIQTSGHSQTPPGSVGQVPPDGISGAISSGHLHTPRHLQGVWDEFPQMESPEQSHPDVWTLPYTSRECGTSSPRQNLWSNVIRTSGHSHTPPGSVGQVPPEGIS